MSTKIRKIEVDFPCPVEVPEYVDDFIFQAIDMMCRTYNKSNPGRRMWISGAGSKPIWREPLEPEFDNDILYVHVSEHEKQKPRSRWNSPDQMPKEDIQAGNEEYTYSVKVLVCNDRNNDLRFGIAIKSKIDEDIRWIIEDHHGDWKVTGWRYLPRAMNLEDL